MKKSRGLSTTRHPISRDPRCSADTESLFGVSMHSLSAAANHAAWGTPSISRHSDSDSAVPCCEPGRSCLPNGMCSSSDTDSNLMQASCTDKSWESAHCPEFCNCKP
ncbi:hypothetical protein KCV03_g259, partial [Aureobasidium melanogenum]